MTGCDERDTCADWPSRALWDCHSLGHALSLPSEEAARKVGLSLPESCRFRYGAGRRLLFVPSLVRRYVEERAKSDPIQPDEPQG